MTTETGQWLELYHRTSAAAAAAIHETGSMTSKENTREVFFSTHDGEHLSGYGDDEFELDDGTCEEHYAINVARLKPEHFID